LGRRQNLDDVPPEQLLDGAIQSRFAASNLQVAALAVEYEDDVKAGFDERLKLGAAEGGRLQGAGGQVGRSGHEQRYPNGRTAMHADAAEESNSIPALIGGCAGNLMVLDGSGWCLTARERSPV